MSIVVPPIEPTSMLENFSMANSSTSAILSSGSSSTSPFLFWTSGGQRTTLYLITLILSLATLRTVLLRKNLKDKHGHSIPPGPLFRYPCLPKYPELPLYKWAKQYGSLFSIWMGNQLFVVINDPVVARDLLVVHGSIFSSRKSYFMKNETILKGGSITAARYDDTWRKHRRIAMTLLTPKAIQGYANMLDCEASQLIQSLYTSGEQGKIPLDIAPFVGSYPLNNMLTLTFGPRRTSRSDPLVKKALEMSHEFMQLTGPWSNAIDFITPLQWIPSRMRTRGRNLYNDFKETYGALVLHVKNEMESGVDVPDCLAKTLIEVQEKEQLSWTDMCFISNVFMTGGVHSTSSVLQWILATMPLYPEVQLKAHEELDRVIGREQWPSAEDERKLPYIRAIIKELLRVHAPFWMGTPHYSDEDFVCDGMFIPKNTVIVLNCYALHHNENRYVDSWSFNPDRYLGDELSSSESSKLGNALQRDHWAFGAGRRICPGMEVAEHELWLAISRLLWAFNMKEVPGEPISLKEYEGMSGRTPVPFRVTLEPRHSGVKAMLNSVDEK